MSAASRPASGSRTSGDIARRTLLQTLTVRPILDDKGAETGMFEVPAGGRQFRALELLVKQKRLARTGPIPCVVRTEGLAEEDSLAGTSSARPFIRSTSSAPPPHTAGEGQVRGGDRGGVLRLAVRWCGSGCASPRCRPTCSTSMPRTA